MSTGAGPGAGTHPPSRLHRLAFAFRDDDGLNLDAEHLALVCPGERLCDLSAGGQATAKIAGSCYLRTLMPIVSSGWAPFPRAPPAAFAKARSQQEGARLGGGEAQRLPLLQCSGSSSASAADDDEPLITDGSAAPSRPTSWAPAPQGASICAGRCVASSVFETEVQVAQCG